MLLPLAAGAAARTWGGALFVGPFTVAVGPGGALSVVGLMLACVGGQIRPRQVGQVAARAGLVLLGATVVPTAVAVGYWWRFGPAGLGGVSAVAVVVVALGTSNALWMALAGRWGTPADIGGGMVAAAVNSGPALALLVLGTLTAGHAGPLPVLAMLDALTPLAVGFVGGMAWPGSRDVMRAALPFLLPVMAWCLGCQLDLRAVDHQLIPGALLGSAEALVSGGLVAAGWVVVLRRPAVVGLAAGGVTIGAVIVPPVVSIAEPTWKPYVATAVAQIAVAVLASTLTIALAAGLWARWRHRPRLGPSPDETRPPALGVPGVPRVLTAPAVTPATPAVGVRGARDRIDRVDRLIVRAWRLRARVAYWSATTRQAGGGTRLDLTHDAHVARFYRAQLGPQIGPELAALVLRAAPRGPLDHTPPPGPVPTWLSHQPPTPAQAHRRTGIAGPPSGGVSVAAPAETPPPHQPDPDQG